MPKIIEKMENFSNEKVESIDLILKQTWLSVSKMYAEIAQTYDFTTVQALTLLKIDPKNGTRSTLLGPKMAIEPTSLTRIIKLLDDEGYIQKEKTTKDKREVILRLTEKGLHARNICKEMVISFNKMVIDKIEPKKMKVFKEVMEQIMDIAVDTSKKNKH